jgi:hypothetical protein
LLISWVRLEHSPLWSNCYPIQGSQILPQLSEIGFSSRFLNGINEWGLNEDNLEISWLFDRIVDAAADLSFDAAICEIWIPKPLKMSSRVWKRQQIRYHFDFVIYKELHWDQKCYCFLQNQQVLDHEESRPRLDDYVNHQNRDIESEILKFPLRGGYLATSYFRSMELFSCSYSRFNISNFKPSDSIILEASLCPWTSPLYWT